MWIRDTDRSPVEGRSILLSMLLRAFWDGDYMEIELPAFHRTMGFLLKELRGSLPAERRREVDELGMSFDVKLKTCRLLDDLLRLFAKEKILETDVDFGDKRMIVFSAETKRRIMRKLSDDHGLTAVENTFLLPLCGRAVKFYQSSVTKDGCGG